MSEGVHFLVLFFIFIIVIIIYIGLIKYLVRLMPSKLSIHVGKHNGIDHLASQSPLFIVKLTSNFRIHLSLLRFWSKRLSFYVGIKEFWSWASSLPKFMYVLDFFLLCKCKILKMSFRYMENPLHKQHNSKIKLKRQIYLVQFFYENISLRYCSNKSWRFHHLVKFRSIIYLDILKLLLSARGFIDKIKMS